MAGLDVRGMLRAAWANLRAGRVRQGGSTITQQLVKNRLLGSERTYGRKVREAWL
jgi:membrane peptidoglycan carboxypeptidase